MPVISCIVNGAPGYKWGNSGHCYTYSPTDEDSRKEAKHKAYLQGVAMGEKVEEDKGLDVSDVHVPTGLKKTKFTDKPWDGSQGRFSEDEWKASTLIHGDTKSECKLPIKEPDGTVNINAVRNALARLSQTEGGDKPKIKAHLERLLEEYKGGVKKSVDLFKMDEEQRLVYGVVLIPDIEDLQNDICDKKDIQEAAHDYLVNSRLIKAQHNAPTDADVVESYIAPADIPLGNGIVPAGSWVLVTKINSDAMWDAVKRGDIRGYSIGGIGAREEM
jgi:hypothetical protein